MGLLGGDSSSSTPTSSIFNDRDSVATDQATANNFTTKFGYANVKDSIISIGGSDVAKRAIDFAENTVATQANFFESTYTKLLNSADTSAARSEANLTAQRQFVADSLSEAQETGDDRLIKTVFIMGALSLGAAVLPRLIK